MKPGELIQQIDDARVIQAIAAAESKTTGEIRVFISSRTLGGHDILQRARSRFRKLGMEATRDRNAVLIYLMPKDRKFAVIGDQGIHRVCGPEFWDFVAQGLATSLQAGLFTDGLVDAISRLGKELSQKFPASQNDNELPDAIERE